MTASYALSWVRCQLCDCLVERTALTSRTYNSRAGDGDAGIRTQVVCQDTAACTARSTRFGHWERVQAEVPFAREPAPGAPLFKCVRCDVAAVAEAVEVTRVLDEQDEVWFTDVACADTDACDRRQNEATPRSWR